MKKKDKTVLKKLCFYILISSFLNYVGCYSPRYVDKDILLTSDLGEPAGVVTIIMKDEKKLVVDEGIYELIGDTLYVIGINKTNTTVYGQNIKLTIALDNIQTVEIEKIDNFRTTACIVSGVVSVSIMILLIVTFSSYKGTPSKCEVG